MHTTRHYASLFATPHMLVVIVCVLCVCVTYHRFDIRNQNVILIHLYTIPQNTQPQHTHSRSNAMRAFV